MPRVRISMVVRAPRRRVWKHLSDLGSHVQWMADAEAIRFIGRQREGVGTEYDCDTRIGPFRTVDRMVVTEWRPRRALAVRHAGIVSGHGRFTLGGRGRRTRVTWEERLRLPWRLGGPLGAPLAKRVLRRVWRGNLVRFKRRVEAL